MKILELYADFIQKCSGVLIFGKVISFFSGLILVELLQL